MKIVSRILAAVALLLFARAAHAADEQTTLAKSFDLHVKPFLKQFCVRCHNAEKMKSGIRVDHLHASLEDHQLRLWEDVRRQIRDATMPPQGATQPTDDQRKRMVGWINQALDLARSRPVPKNGMVRRLTVSQ